MSPNLSPPFSLSLSLFYRLYKKEWRCKKSTGNTRNGARQHHAYHFQGMTFRNVQDIINNMFQGFVQAQPIPIKNALIGICRSKTLLEA